LEDVRVLLFGMGVSILNPKSPSHDDLREQIQALTDAGVEVAACVSIAEELGLEEGIEEMGIKLVHASVYTARHVSEGYTIITF
jgi:hypothetical protein